LHFSVRPSDSDFSEFSAYEAPNGERTVVVDSAHSVLAYGAETIRVYVSGTDTGARTHVVTTKIANDGSDITSENVRAEWIHTDVLSLCLTGMEQDDRILEIDVRMLSYAERTQKCSR